jgi:hypothetical protein
MDVTMVMVVVALTVKDEDERERKKRTVAAQGTTQGNDDWGTRIHGTAGKTRYDPTYCSKEGIGQGMMRSKRIHSK